MVNSDILVEYDDELERMKLTIRLRRKWAFIALYTISLIIWLTMLIVVLVYLLGGKSTSIILTLLLVMWMVVWLSFGRFLWKRWQFQFANREIIFIDHEQLIIRRPVSILGITYAYDMSHIGPFYISQHRHCPAFDYAYQHVYVGQDLSDKDADELVKILNERWFADSLDE